MEIENGAEVIDKNGKKLGTVNRVIRDSYTSEITKFTVSTDITETDLFFSPGEVQEATAGTVKLGIAFDQGESLEVKYGAEVIDKNGKNLGTVDYPVRDALTGEIKSFRINSPHMDNDVFISTGDLLEVTPVRIKLKISLDEINRTG